LILPNATAQDARLSWAARGLLIELLSRPSDWETNADALWRTSKQQRGEQLGEGRRAIRAAFAKLEELGYIVRSRTQIEKGRFVTTVDVYDTPDHHRGTANGTSVTGTSVSAISASGTSLQSTDTQRTDLQTTEDKHSSTLADTRVAALAARKKSQLHDLYTAVNGTADQDLRNALLKFEQRRPRIYRECRNSAIDQIGGDDPRALKGDGAGREIDTLSYKYALRHYHDTADEWPAWLIRPLLAAGGRAA
jgi:hypothetical protein